MYQRFDSEEDNQEIYAYYCNEENYEVSSNVRVGGVHRAIIFFTGHGLYFPTTIDEFRKTVVNSNRYEWKNVCEDSRIKEQADMFIYVRDVYKNWCIEGINSRINSQEKLASKLKELVSGREIITVGSSAGGYMALLFGVLLNAKRIFAFSPQVNLYEYYKDHPYAYYEEYCKNMDISKHMNLKPLIETYKGVIYFWYPAKCSEDIRQYNCVSDCKNVRFFALNQSTHGHTLWGESIIVSLCMLPQRLDSLSRRYTGKIVSPFIYCRDTSGVLKAMIIFVGKKVKSLKQK